MFMPIKTKTVTIDGKKYLEKSFKKVIPVSDYGISTINGAQIAAEANLAIGFKIDPAKQYIMLRGYLNNKLIPGTNEPAKDSYGDIPTGDNVYDTDRLINNPVALINHENDASAIAGNYIYLKEDAQGLMFKEILRPLDEIYEDSTKDAVSAWGNGWGKAYSIGGRWLYDMEKSRPEDNMYLLVKAILHEASHVAIGADQWALSSVPDNSQAVDQGKNAPCGTLEVAIDEYLKTNDDSLLVKELKI